jgi:hypothetical protein
MLQALLFRAWLNLQYPRVAQPIVVADNPKELKYY